MGIYDILDDVPAFQAVLMVTGNTSPDSVAYKSYVAASALLKRINNGICPDREKDMRALLAELLNCFWFFREHRIQFARLMHDIGKELCKKYECHFKFDGANYYSECPNFLLHYDFGFSLRALEEYVCSICGEDPLKCDHISGYEYDDVICRDTDGNCNICGSKLVGCGHEAGKKYDHVRAVKVIKNLEVITFDLVKEPDMVYTRITKMPFSKKDILSQLRDDPWMNEFEYGASPLYCRHCIYCTGYDPERTKQLFERA